MLYLNVPFPDITKISVNIVQDTGLHTLWTAVILSDTLTLLY